MNPLTPSKNATILPLLIALTLGCIGLLPQARAVDPPPDGGYPNQNTAGGDDALGHTTDSDNAPLVSWSWRTTGRLNTARDYHTATLLQNGMVLVAGGHDSHSNRLASAELYDPASRTWTATGSLNTGRDYHTATLLPKRHGPCGRGIGGLASASRARNCTTRRAGPGLPRAASTTHVPITRRRCCQNGMVLVAGGYSNFTLFRER